MADFVKICIIDDNESITGMFAKFLNGLENLPSPLPKVKLKSCKIMNQFFMNVQAWSWLMVLFVQRGMLNASYRYIGSPVILLRI